MWVPKDNISIKVELITRTSTARPTLKSEPYMTSKVPLSKHTNKRPILGVTIRHRVFEDNREVRRLQVDTRIIGDHIINFHHLMHQCIDKGIHIQVCLLVFHDLDMVVGCTMMSLYILHGLFQSHIHVIDLHGCIKIDYYIEDKNK
jgi:hypothetical protein